jgi:hypothetical protein
LIRYIDAFYLNRLTSLIAICSSVQIEEDFDYCAETKNKFDLTKYCSDDTSSCLQIPDNRTILNDEFVKIGEETTEPIVFFSNRIAFHTICAKIRAIQIVMGFNKCTKYLIIQFNYNEVLKTGFLTTFGVIRSNSFFVNCNFMKKVFISNERYEISKQGKTIFVKFKVSQGFIYSFLKKFLSRDHYKKVFLLFFLIFILVFVKIFLFLKKCIVSEKLSVNMRDFKTDVNQTSNSTDLHLTNETNKNSKNEDLQKKIISNNESDIIELENSKKIRPIKNKNLSIKTISFGLNLLADVAEGLMINEELKLSSITNQYNTRSKKKTQFNA